MKIFKFKKVLLVSVLLILGMNFALSVEESSEMIVKKVNELFNVDSGYMKVKMIIETTSGKKRTLIYESWQKNKGEKNLVRYLEPRRVKGQAVLMLNNADDIWMYFPRTQRVRKMATHAKKQKMQGSDFSYEDMGSGDAFLKDYNSKCLKDEKMEGQECFKVELIRKPEVKSTYVKMVMWVEKTMFVPLAIDYYNESDPDRVEKRMIEREIKIIDNIPTAMKIIMFNKNDNTRTEMEMLEVKYNLSLNDRMFTERELKK